MMFTYIIIDALEKGAVVVRHPTKFDLKFKFQINNILFSMSMSRAVFGHTHTKKKKLLVAYLKFKFSWVPDIFIC